MKHLVNGLEISRYKESKGYILDFVFKFMKYFFILNISFGIFFVAENCTAQKTGEDMYEFMEIYFDFFSKFIPNDLTGKSLLSEIFIIVMGLIFFIIPFVLPTIILILIFYLVAVIIRIIKPDFFSGNHSIHYFENCLYIRPFNDSKVLGEIPYEVISKFCHKENEIEIIFKNSSDFDCESTYHKFLKEKNVLATKFKLNPSLKKYAIEIVQELNAKVMH